MTLPTNSVNYLIANKMELKDQVESILSFFPETRDSDIALMIQLWKRYYPERLREDSVQFVSLYGLPTQDNIKRIRATIQNVEMRLLPTQKKIFIERARLSKVWRKRLGYNGTSVSTKNFDLILSEHFDTLSIPKQASLF